MSRSILLCKSESSVIPITCRGWLSIPNKTEEKIFSSQHQQHPRAEKFGGSWFQLETAGATTNYSLSSNQSPGDNIHCGSGCQQGVSYFDKVPSLLEHPQASLNMSTESDGQYPHIRICLPSTPPSSIVKSIQIHSSLLNFSKSY